MEFQEIRIMEQTQLFITEKFMQGVQKHSKADLSVILM